MLREQEQLKLGETMSRISKWHVGFLLLLLLGENYVLYINSFIQN